MINQFADLPVFVTVVDCGSFSQAAKQLNLTKSAVSKRISHLEDGLGIRLLNRTTRKLSLTEAGQRYYDYASQALSLAKRGVDAVSELHGSPQGRLKITAPMTFGVLHVAPLISEFLAVILRWKSIYNWKTKWLIWSKAVLISASVSATCPTPT